VRVFDPSKACILSRRQSEYKGIPGFSEVVPADEFNKYIANYTPEAVTAAGGLWSSANVD